MFLYLVAIFICTVLYISFSSKDKKIDWKKYGVPKVQYASFFEAMRVILGKKTFSDIDEAVYHQLGDTQKFCAFDQLGSPTFLVKDIDVVKKIMIKDFSCFMDRRTMPADGQPSVSKMVVNLTGEEWKGVRTNLSPTFTTGKIRRMMDFFNSTSHKWAEHFMQKIQTSGGQSVEIDVEKEAINFALDVIASTVFGMKVGAIRNEDEVFSKMVAKFTKVDIWVTIKFGILANFPKLAKLMGMKVLDPESLQFFESLMSQGMKRRMTGAEKRNDFLQIISEARTGDLKAHGSDELSAFEKEAVIQEKSGLEKKNWLNDDAVAMAQLMQFFTAGFSTVSNFIGFMMYCLALHPECQEKLRKEVDAELFKDGKEDIDYDVLQKLEYLDMIACETLRKFPILGRIERKCTSHYRDNENNFEIPKDVNVAIPVQALHNDPKFYKYPDKFYPEHFTPEEKANRNSCAFLPFGTGPRNCIGMRFALVESKVAIAHLVHNLEISPAPCTPIPCKVRNVGIGVQLPFNLKLKLSPVKR